MALGILSVVVVSTGTLIGQFMRAQKLVESRDQSNEFAAAISQHLQNSASCRSSLVRPLSPVTIQLPPPPAQPGATVIAPAFALLNFSAYHNELSTLPAPQAGYMINNSTRVRSLGIQLKPSLANPTLPEFVPVGPNRFRTTAQIQLILEVIDPNTRDPVTNLPAARPMPARYFEVPVITQGNVPPVPIVDCLGAVDSESACTAASGVWNPLTMNCNPSGTGNNRCIMRGSYVVYSYDPPYGIPDPSPEQQTNPMTFPPIQGCPPGSTPTLMGSRAWRTAYSCGKKCTQYVNHREQYYSCLVCP